MDMAFEHDRMEISSGEILSMECNKAVELWPMYLVLTIKEASKTVVDTVREDIGTLMAANTLETLKMAKLMAMVNIHFQMDAVTRAILLTTLPTGQVSYISQTKSGLEVSGTKMFLTLTLNGTIT